MEETVLLPTTVPVKWGGLGIDAKQVKGQNDGIYGKICERGYLMSLLFSKMGVVL